MNWLIASAFLLAASVAFVSVAVLFLRVGFLCARAWIDATAEDRTIDVPYSPSGYPTNGYHKPEEVRHGS